MPFQRENEWAVKPGEARNPNGRPKKLKFYEIVDKILDLPIKELPPVLKEAALELTDDANKTARDAGAARVVKEMFTGSQSFLKEAMDRIEGPVVQKSESKIEGEMGEKMATIFRPLIESIAKRNVQGDTREPARDTGILPDST